MNGLSAGEPTAVTIFGRTYQLRGGTDAARLVGLAAEVDRRMRDVADATCHLRKSERTFRLDRIVEISMES